MGNKAQGKSARGRRQGGAKTGASRQRPGPTTAIAPGGRFRIIATASVAFVFVAALAMLARLEMPADDKRSAVAPARPEKSDTDDDTLYTFYSRLRDFEIEVFDSGEPQSPKQRTRYLIQAGSFKTREQAERRLVELKLLGLEPRIDETVNKDGSRWQRVLLGPYDSRSRMSGVRSALLGNDIDAMVMHRRSKQ